jgi:uncharacterized membrane protein
MKKNNTRKLAQSATIAAIYVALTYIANMLGLSSGAIQIRFSEALCILPVFTVSAVWGLLLGCLLANILTGSILIDIIFGSLATLIGAILTRRFKDNFTLAVASPILSNTFIIPFVLKFAYGFEGSIFFFALTIFIGEFLSCGVLGYPLFKALSKRRSLFN